MEIQLHKDAILTKEIVNKEEEVTESGLVILPDTAREKLFEVIKIGSDVKELVVGDTIRAKEIFGEDITIGHKVYKYFPHGDSCYYYKLI